MKLDFDLNKKGAPEPEVKQPNAKEAEEQQRSSSPPPVNANETDYPVIDNNVGMNWYLIAKMGNIQFLLSCIASVSLLATMSIIGFSLLRFTSSAWTTYLMSTAYIAVRAGRWRSYPHVIAYCGMVMFQTVIYMSSLCWVAYSLYGAEYQLHTSFRTDAMFSTANPNALLALIVVEMVSLMGTVFTGVFGMIACCRGLGKMLHHMEQLIVAGRYTAPAPHITVRSL
ncbi:hypothetical protein ANCCAN_12808 [Ancylostoma caninum]|uniref:Uncharacterized protein n=1 Tax=Ancylostoma caninum TaxID=29170 RepID=A0A368GA37_ANCCA|nr:hypothetical protein ANCCAN_12808 [Ancylostoma caninum]